jgi:lysophospholipase L1-like esterase
VTGNPGTQTIFGGVVVGGYGSSYQVGMDLVRLIVCDGSLSGTNKTAIENYLIYQYGVGGNKILMVDGDSITNGYGLSSPSTQNWASQFVASNPSYKLINMGVTSQTCATILTNYPTTQGLQYSTLQSKNIYWLWCGTNDINYGATDTALETTVQSIAVAAHAAGVKIGFASIIARNGFSTGQESYRQAFNTWARANWATYFDEFSDLGNDSTIGCPTGSPSVCYGNTTYFQGDGIHLTATGATYVASLNSPYILAF